MSQSDLDPPRPRRRPRRIYCFPAAAAMIAVLFFSLLASSTAATAASFLRGTDSVDRWGAWADGPSDQQTVPTQVPKLRGISSVLASNSFSLALASNGSVWTWGNDSHGQLGDGTTSGSTTVTPVKAHLPFHAVSLGEGKDYGLAISPRGDVWGWGYNAGGQLCLGNTTDQPTPVRIPGLKHVVAAAGGNQHSLFLLANGTMVACGVDTYGELGNGVYESQTDTPVAVDISDVTSISIGAYFSVAVKTDGTVWAWGDNSQGELGNGTKVKSDVPVQVHLPTGLTARQVFAGGDFPNNGHVLAILSDGSVWAWGDNNRGQLGDGTLTNSSLPVPVQVPTGVTFTYVAAGGTHSLALDSTGNVWAWGDNTYGQLGDGLHEPYSASPIEVDSGVDQIWTTANDNLDHHP
jgi:alpha-tubulin suppressor-like RCC1 family protein